jgi:hypothetical protein
VLSWEILCCLQVHRGPGTVYALLRFIPGQSGTHQYSFAPCASRAGDMQTQKHPNIQPMAQGSCAGQAGEARRSWNLTTGTNTTAGCKQYCLTPTHRCSTQGSTAAAVLALEASAEQHAATSPACFHPARLNDTSTAIYTAVTCLLRFSRYQVQCLPVGVYLLIYLSTLCSRGPFRGLLPA